MFRAARCSTALTLMCVTHLMSALVRVLMQTCPYHAAAQVWYHNDMAIGQNYTTCGTAGEDTVSIPASWYMHSNMSELCMSSCYSAYAYHTLCKSRYSYILALSPNV